MNYDQWLSNEPERLSEEEKMHNDEMEEISAEQREDAKIDRLMDDIYG